MEGFIKDLRFGVRRLLRDRSFTITAVATLAVCIGANAAIFSVVKSVLLNPLPVPESQQIVLAYNSYPGAGVERAESGIPDYYDRLEHLSDLLEEQALYSGRGFTIGENGRPSRISGMAVTPSFFRLLAVPARIGRVFSEEEGVPGQHRKVILSDSLWQGLYGGKDDAIGQQLKISGLEYSVVGVMPPDFVYLDPGVKAWVPLAFDEEDKSDQNRHNNSWEYIARLRPGATLDQVRAKLDALSVSNLDLTPALREPLKNAGFHVRALLLKDEVIKDVKATLNLLWAAVVFVLLIGGVNIANLVLARSNVRMKELAMRSALGARAGRVARQLLTEGVLLAVLSGALGIGLGHLGLQALKAIGMDRLPRGSEISMDFTVVLIVLAAAVVLGVLIAVPPAAQFMRSNLNGVLREEGRTGTVGRSGRLLRNALVVTQVAFAFILLIGAGLLLASFREVISIDPGFHEGASVLTGRVSPPGSRYPESLELRAFVERSLGRLRALPGVQAVGATDTIPFGGNYSDSVIFAEGYVPEPGESVVSPSRVTVTAGYFEAMGIELKEGRTFDARDHADSLQTVMVDEKLANKFWPRESAIGKRLYQPNDMTNPTAIGPDTPLYSIVGVVGSVKMRALVDPDERPGAYYFPYTQRPSRSITFAIRTSLPPDSMMETVRNELAAIDPELPLYRVQTMDASLQETMVVHRSPMILALSFGALALFLAAVGIYGVLAYLVTQRTREIGIRIALGSNSRGIFRLILSEGVAVLGVGLGVGFLGVVGLSRFIAGVLYGVRPMEPTVLALTAAMLGVIALAACVLPAIRATRIDPVRALGAE